MNHSLFKMNLEKIIKWNVWTETKPEIGELFFAITEQNKDSCVSPNEIFQMYSELILIKNSDIVKDRIYSLSEPIVVHSLGLNKYEYNDIIYWIYLQDLMI